MFYGKCWLDLTYSGEEKRATNKKLSINRRKDRLPLNKGKDSSNGLYSLVLRYEMCPRALHKTRQPCSNLTK